MRIERIAEPEPTRFEPEAGVTTRDLEPEVYWNRRSWIFGVCGLLAGGAITASLQAVLGPDREEDAFAPMLVMDADDLFRRAGDLENLARRGVRRDPMADGFERMLRLSLQLDRPFADEAGACAVRILVDPGRLDRARSLLATAGSDRPRPLTRAALELAQRR